MGSDINHTHKRMNHSGRSHFSNWGEVNGSQDVTMFSYALTSSLNVSNTSAASNLSPHDAEWAASGVMSESAQAGLVVLYSITTLLSIVGNVLVIVVFTRGRQCRTDIRRFLVNLAVADLIMAVFCMPFTFSFVMLGTWIFSKPMCPIVLFMQHLSVSASVFTNMAISTDRFLVVVFPLHSRVMTARAKYVLAAIWACAFALSSVQLVVGRANEWDDGAVTCDEVWGSQAARRTFTLLMLVLTYIVPLSIVALAYGVVGKVLWTRAPPGNAHYARDTHQLQAKRKVVKMLVVVVVMFALCWLPLHVFILLLDFRPDLMEHDSLEEERFFVGLFYTVHWMAMANSFINPIIYSFSNESFRVDLVYIFKGTFSSCNCVKRLTSNSKHSSSLRNQGSSSRLRTIKSGHTVNSSRRTTDQFTRGLCRATDPRASRGAAPRRPPPDRNRMYIQLNKDSPAAAATRSPVAQCAGDQYQSSGAGGSPLKTTGVTFV
ncbi:prolactin-releasing peptide receptor-like [Babylonia areolata]|uniref:prolactin-releasing peptide receptor-like n=1 Tax=Babylonia areolata TaxID=304850 RepID=UPI003FD3D319